MASRGHTWFGAEKLLPGEELVQTAPARLRTDTPPYWWEGELILTSDRLFFLPYIDNPLDASVAFWLRDVIDLSLAGRNRFHIRTATSDALLHLLNSSPRTAVGLAAVPWVRRVRGAMRTARPAAAFAGGHPRRAAG